MLGRFCLLNKIQFTFEVAPCLISGLFRQFFRGVHQFNPSITRGWVGGGEGRGGQGWGGRRKTSQVKTQGHQLPSDGPDHSTRPKGHHFGPG